MVYLAITPQGLAEALRQGSLTGAAVWCGSDAISLQDYERARPEQLSRFNYELRNADRNTMIGAIQTIEEHHPNERIWVEARAEA